MITNLLFSFVTSAINGLTGFFLSLLSFIMTFVVQIASYNDFLKSTAVNIGWVMIRDLTNMIFVVALLIIAFATILGVEHYEWKHMLFKLVSAAVLVNFSRTICGIIIDAAQVVMITFVNGIAATIGGNIIRAFSLTSIRSFSTTLNPSELTQVNVFVAVVASFFIALTILVAMGILCAVLVVRVIVLWVLIVLSPVAFAFSVLHQTEHYAEEWWSAFGKNVITGPVLVFFLWLTLATVGNGNISNEVKFGSDSSIKISPQDSSTIGEVMRWDNLVNFAIAIGMLLVGLKVTHHIGGIGAGWAEHAVDIGKEWTGAVSGFNLARGVAKSAYSTAEKGIELVKENAPIIGKKSWERRGKKIKGLATGLNEFTGIYRDRAQSYLEGKNSLLGFASGLILESGRRADMKAENYETWGKNLGDIHQEDASTSKTLGGRMKLDSTRLAEMVKKTAAEKKKQKFADKDLELADESNTSWTAKRFREYSKTFAKASVEGAESAKLHHLEEEMSVEGLREKRMEPVSFQNTLQTKDQKGKDTAYVAINEAVNAGKLSDKEGLELIEKAERGEDVALPVDARILYGSAEDAKERVAAELKSKSITKEQADDMNARLDHQFKGVEIAEIGSKLQQIKEATGGATKLEEAKATEHLMDHDKSVQARQAKISSFSAEMKQIEEKTASKKELELLTAIKHLLANPPGSDRQKVIADLVGKKDLAKLENEKKNLLIRADVAGQQKNYVAESQFRRQAYSLEFNKIQEGFKNADMNSNERANLAATIAKRMLELNKKGSLSVDENKELADLTKQKVALEAVNMSKEAYDAQADHQRSLQAIGWTEEFSDENAIRRSLSVKLGYVVKEGEEDKAREALKARLGGTEGNETDKQEMYNAAMRQIGHNAKNQISRGNRDAVVYEENLDDKTGRTVYDIANKTGEQMAGIIATTLAAWLRSGDIRASTIKQAVGTRNEQTVDKEGKPVAAGSHITALSKEQIEFNASIYTGANAGSILKDRGGVLGDLNEAQLDDTTFKSLLDAFADKVANEAAFDALLKQFEKVIKTSGISQDQMDDSRARVKKTKVSTPAPSATPAPTEDDEEAEEDGSGI